MGVEQIVVQVFKAFGQNSNKTIAYSDLKGLLSSGKIEYVGIGKYSNKAVSKVSTGQVVTYTARRVIPDDTLIPELEKNNIAYGGVSEENIPADILFGWVLPIFVFLLFGCLLLKNAKINGWWFRWNFRIGSSKK